MALLKTYPQAFEEKVGFDQVRELLKKKTCSLMGKEEIDALRAEDDSTQIMQRLERVKELLLILQEGRDFPSLSLEDLRRSLDGIRPEGTYLSEDRLPHLLQAIRTMEHLYRFLGYQQATNPENAEPLRYLALLQLLPEGLLLPHIAQRIDSLLDRFGRIQDSASPELRAIRTERSSVERSMARQIRSLLAQAIREGWADEEARPSLRDGHPVIPVNPSYKRNIPGIVHDESSSGKTVFIEPIEIVESNNRMRELDAAERREIIRILILLADDVRPHIPSLFAMYQLVGVFDALFAIARFSQEERAIVPVIEPRPYLDWKEARHPLLRRTLQAEQRELVPIDLALKAPNARILLISGPNAGGKSVCLKTCALLQYMLQMGMPIPVHPDSTAGLFSSLAINIGDDQSIEDDLSTYSSHLVSMRHFCRIASPRSLLLIDEFGAGTEPELGGAIAEALLAEFNAHKSFALITTHYRNLKQYASCHQGIINGAMLYDRGAMRPLFRLSIGQPGSSFAIEIAKKSGLPKGVLEMAESLVGKEMLDTDKYVQEIARDKRYWEKKRDNIRRQERQLEEEIEKYSSALAKLHSSRKEVLAQAQDEAQRLLKESNARIERTIREIKESNAEREKTLLARQELQQFAQETSLAPSEKSQSEASQAIDREWQRIENRRKRKEEKRRKASDEASQTASKTPKPLPLEEGCKVRIVSQNGIEGTLLELRGRQALVALGGTMQTMIEVSKLERVVGNTPKTSALTERTSSNITEHIHEKKTNFREELDVRGMRALDALQAVEYYLDEAIQVGCHRVRILHGTGTGALRQSIRQMLPTRPYVLRFYDEDVRFGGAGITIVEL